MVGRGQRRPNTNNKILVVKSGNATIGQKQ